jgi:hypothetical protein
MVRVQQNRNPIMGRYRANGSRLRAKLSDSAPKIKSDERRDKRKETNDTLVIQHPNEISHDVVLGYWDSFGTLFLMGALVFIGKLI